MSGHTRCEHLTDCPACGARLRWIGAVVDQPPCACGYRPDPAQLERDQRAVDELLAGFLTTATTMESR